VSDPNDIIPPPLVNVPNPNARPITQDEIDLAFKQKQSSMVGGARTYLGIGAFAVGTGIEHTLIGRAALGLSGFHSAPPGSRIAVRPGVLALSYGLPAPFGIVPPEEYRARPNYLTRILPESLHSETLGIHTTPERVAVFEARERARGLLVAQENLLGKPPVKVSTQQLRDDVAFLMATKDVIPQSAQALPFYAKELANRDVLPVEPNGVLRVPSALGDPLASSPAAYPPRTQPADPLPQLVIPGPGGIANRDRDLSNIDQWLGVKSPAPLDTPPMSTEQQRAFAHANDVVRHLIGERGDP